MLVPTTLAERIQMRRSIIAAAITLLPALAAAQGGAAQAGDASRAVAGGGISVAGWKAALDPKEAMSGATIEQAKLVKDGDALKVTTGPAIAYYNPANTAAGTYTVKATFTEKEFMGLNNHSHPYGVFIGGNDLAGPNASYLYCTAYGDGRYIMRGFGPAAFQVLGGGRGAPAPSINKASSKGQPVTQEIAINVTADAVECAINGTVVGSAPKADVIAAGKLKSTDGVYGIRFGHNTEATVTGLTMVKK
jgi:hypothetical protein